VVLSRVVRVSLGPMDTDLVGFFEGLDRLPKGRRNAALLAAIRGGAGEAGRLLAAEDEELAEAAGGFLA
jgi:hypothetical protein